MKASARIVARLELGEDLDAGARVRMVLGAGALVLVLGAAGVLTGAAGLAGLGWLRGSETLSGPVSHLHIAALTGGFALLCGALWSAFGAHAALTTKDPDSVIGEVRGRSARGAYVAVGSFNRKTVEMALCAPGAVTLLWGMHLWMTRELTWEDGTGLVFLVVVGALALAVLPVLITLDVFITPGIELMLLRLRLGATSGLPAGAALPPGEGGGSLYWARRWLLRRDLDPETRDALLPEFEGTLGEFVAVVRSLGPAAPRA